MSLYLIADIETTGLNRSYDDILEFSYLIMDSKTMQVVDAAALFFYHPEQRNSHPEAFKVHGLTKQYLKQYEDQFYDNLAKMYKVFTMSNFVGYNSRTFDIPFIAAFLRRFGYGDPKVNNDEMDVMSIYTPIYGRTKLVKLVEILKFDESTIKLLQNHYYKGYPFKQSAHNASYDVIETMMAFTEACERGYIS